jgi:hypothetical protein
VSDDLRERRRLSEDVAHRLLARAVELDTPGGAEITIAQLREAAVDAGVSESAFNAAVAELERAGYRSSTSSKIDVQASSTEPRASRLARFTGSVIRNVGALAASGAFVAAGAMLIRATNAPDLLHKVSDALAMGLGALLASRWRARPAMILLAGLSIALGAEVLFDVLQGSYSVRGFGAHMALMVAGVAGVLLGAYAMGRPSGSSTDTTLDVRNEEEAPTGGSRASSVVDRMDLARPLLS